MNRTTRVNLSAVGLAARQPEAEFQRQVMDAARLYGWATAHFRPLMDRRGRWRTAVQGDGAGWPDIVLCRERVIYAELKAAGGKLTPAQETWIERLRRAGQEVYVWFASDWDKIEAVLAK